MTGCAKKKVQSNPVAGVHAVAQRAGRRGGSGARSQRGAASWYGHPYHGRQAADGEIYDMETMVAAHRTLPFQTWVRVRNVSNDKTVDVRIIDRGPFVDGRMIDLSHAAAQADRPDRTGRGAGGADDHCGPGETRSLAVRRAGGGVSGARQCGPAGAEPDGDVRRGEDNREAGQSEYVARAGGTETSADAAEALAQRIRGEQHVPEAFVVRLEALTAPLIVDAATLPAATEAAAIPCLKRVTAVETAIVMKACRHGKEAAPDGIDAVSLFRTGTSGIALRRAGQSA